MNIHASPYYGNLPGPNSIPARLAERQRHAMFEVFASIIGADKNQTVLDVGATDNETYRSDNYFEALYPFKDKITASGLEDASHLVARYPGMKFVRVKPGPMPFADGQFDVAHSSAVIEHVGSHANQADFIREMWRVTKKAIFITTPNRWFPVEFHTVLPLVHWLPPETFRAILRAKGEKFFCKEENLNLLSTNSLYAAAQEAGIASPLVVSVRLWGWPSNLMLIAFH